MYRIQEPRQLETLEPRFMLASSWQNSFLQRDVDNSGAVIPLDALVVINEVNRNGPRLLPTRSPTSNEPFYDVDGDGNVSPLDALVVINALNSIGTREPSVVAGISPDSDPNSNGVVLRNDLSIRGQALPNSEIVATLGDNSTGRITIRADADGKFAVPFTVPNGRSNVRLSSRDELGRLALAELQVLCGNTIQDWNAAALDVVRQWAALSNDPYENRIVTSQPPMVARNLAMIHAAMFDAANAIAGRYLPYKTQVPLQSGASPEAAAAAAAFEVAKALYSKSDEVAIWQASLDETLAQVPDGVSRVLGIQLGKQIGQAMIADRANDGVKSASLYTITYEPGHWRRTFPDYLPPLLPQWPMVKTFAVSSASEFQVMPPPSLSSPDYASAVDQVMRLGSFQSNSRTAEQTEIALFWADGGGTYTPPGHWNQIASDVTIARGTNLVDTARTFALVNLAMADAGIAAWNAKYSYDFWRPIDAIRLADQDANPATTPDANWMPLLKTPPFPTYTSGHSAFSGAASTVLSNLFGDQTSFDSETDSHSGPEQRPLDPSQIFTRHFQSFSQAAEEAGMSRIYGGIHFSFDNTAGLELGRAIGNATIERLLR